MDQAMNPNLLSELQAIDIAESVIEGTVMEMEFNQNEGIYIYELILTTKNGKAVIKLDAISGMVINKLEKTRIAIE
ncbi:PepSY domain-containing protein [Ornithinibacillus californiensis]|uniref:PepSY domain-containing protein n=1 Tax=Ornithinibacillus californiensis TaxID=161536 RepID=UPI00064D85B3|nr:PepSY domain-containing protein [Ornithinibacillus californiensis]